jgi:hypothetical protein
MSTKLQIKEHLPLDNKEQIRICVGIDPMLFPNFHPGPRPRGPIDPTKFHPAGIELAMQVYNHLFTPIDASEFRELLVSQSYLPSNNTTEPKTCEEDGETWLDFSELEDEEWDYYCITFDHLVPAEQANPEVLVLRVDTELKVTRNNGEQDRRRVNEEVRLMREGHSLTGEKEKKKDMVTG